MSLAEILNWSVALIPVLVMVVLFAWLDVFKLMAPRELVGPLIMGGFMALVAWPISGQMLDTLPMGYSFYSRMVAPWIEEALKAVPVMILIAANRVGYKIDAIIFGFAIGAGFSVVENGFYLVRYPDLTMPVWIVRGLGTAVMHGTTTAILAAVAHELGEREAARPGDRLDVQPAVVRARLYRREPHPHHLQPVPGPAGPGDAGDTGRRADRRSSACFASARARRSNGWSRKAKGTASGWRNGAAVVSRRTQAASGSRHSPAGLPRRKPSGSGNIAC